MRQIMIIEQGERDLEKLEVIYVGKRRNPEDLVRKDSCLYKITDLELNSENELCISHRTYTSYGELLQDKLQMKGICRGWANLSLDKKILKALFELTKKQ